MDHPRAATRRLAHRAVTYDPATRLWFVTALGPKLGGRRGPAPATVTGQGPDELAALCDLAARLGVAG